MRYRAEIDGLRAVAIIPVILFHAGFQPFSGGFVGVDVFFVISGYLITSAISEEQQAGNFSLITFYERRARRILPALLLVMATCIPFAWMWLMPNEMKDFSQSLVAVSAFVSNILFWRESGYFDTVAELKPLLHTWSLAVEEQYYLLFPVFLLLTWKLGKRWIFFISIVLTLFSLAIAEWGSLNHPSAAFYLLPTRGWELLIGALVAFHLSEKDEIGSSNIFSLLGLFLIGYSIFTFNSQMPFPSLYTLVPTLGVALIILFTGETTLLFKVLSCNMLVGIGLISYSAYLWHQPLFAFARYGNEEEPSMVFMSVLAAGSLAIAYVSWKFVEKPFRDRCRYTRNQIFSLGLMTSSILIGVGVFGHISDGFAFRFDARERQILDFVNYPQEVFGGGECFLKAEQSYVEFSSKCESVEKGDVTLIWGDSYAAALSYGLRQLFLNVAQLTASACPPIGDYEFGGFRQCKGINDYVMRKIERIKPSHLLLHANWLLYKDQNLLGNIKETIDYIREVSPSTSITIVGAVPQWRPILPYIMIRDGLTLEAGQYIRNDGIKRVTDFNNELRAVAAKAGVGFFSPTDVLCIQSECLVSVGLPGKLMPTAWDSGHLTEAASLFLIKKMFGK